MQLRLFHIGAYALLCHPLFYILHELAQSIIKSNTFFAKELLRSTSTKRTYNRWLFFLFPITVFQIPHVHPDFDVLESISLAFVSHFLQQSILYSSLDLLLVQFLPRQLPRFFYCFIKRVVPNSLLRLRKKLSESYANYHDDMNGDVFKIWFKNTFLKNLPQDRKVLIVMYNTRYHSRLSEKMP